MTTLAARFGRPVPHRDELFRLAMQAGRVGLWDWDVADDRITWSESLYGIHGLDHGKVPLSVAEFFELVHPGDRDLVIETTRRALERDGQTELEFRVLRPDGNVVWVFLSARAVRSGGRALRLVGTTIDVTERKRVELALRESEERFAKAFNSSPLSLTISSLKTGRLVEVNQTFEDVTGFSREEAIGKTTAELGVWAQPGDREEELAAVEAAGQLRNREYRFVVRDGREITGLLSAETLEIGGELCALTVIQDITERKKFEQQLREADRRKDEFLATLAHELRNPLAPLRNGIQILQIAGADPATTTSVLAMMDRQLGQMVRMVDDLLDVSRISRGTIDLRLEPVEMSAVVTSALETSRPVIDARGHRLLVDVPREPILARADRTRLSQVVANLLNNAAKYTPPGGEIRLAVAADDREILLRVRDNGIGIPAPMLSQVFELFTQIDGSLEKSQSGLGIGLTIVRRLVEMHDGSVEARSEGPGRGSEFVVRLPRLDDPPAAKTGAAATSSAASAPRRVLVVDDNRDSAESMKMMLETMGHETRSAHDGRQAVELADSFQPDAILLDIGMPNMNGYEACRRIRSRPWAKHVLLVAMTGWGHENDRRRSREAGFDHHWIKPVDAEALQRLLAGEEPRRGA